MTEVTPHIPKPHAAAPACIWRDYFISCTTEQDSIGRLNQAIRSSKIRGTLAVYHSYIIAIALELGFGSIGVLTQQLALRWQSITCPLYISEVAPRKREVRCKYLNNVRFKDVISAQISQMDNLI